MDFGYPEPTAWGVAPSLNIGRTQSINTRAQNEDLVCPITSEIFQDPVLCVGDGQTYERSAVERWFAEGNETSPLTGAKLEEWGRKVTHNVDMRRRVNRLTDGHAEKVTDEAPAADETTDIDVISFVHGSDVISPRHAPMGIHALNGAIATAPPLESAEDLDAASNDGWTPLHSSAAEGNVQLVKEMISAKISVYAKNKEGETPLQP